MDLGLIIETSDPGRVWNAFRLATTALDEGRTVEAFLLGEGVEAPDADAEKVNPCGVMQKDTRNGSEGLARGGCLDSRGMERDDLRRRATMEDHLRVVTDAENALTIG